VSEQRIVPDACLADAWFAQAAMQHDEAGFSSSAFVSWASALIAETASSAPKAVVTTFWIDISTLLIKRTALAVRASRNR
jgi:hypothetical protein